MSRSPFLTLVGRDARNSARLLVLLCLGVALVGYLMAASFPAFQERMLQAGKRAPAFVRKMLEARAGGFTVESYVAMAFMHPVAFAMMSAWPIARASRAVAGEIERGSLGWLLAYPLGRTRYLLGRALVVLAGTGAIALALVAGLRLTYRFLAIPHGPLVPYLWAALWTFLLYGAVGMLTLWVSASSTRASTPAIFGAGLVIGSFMLEFLGEAYEPIKPFRWLSIYHYFEHQAILTGAAPDWKDAAVLGALLLVGLAGALWRFRRRDLNI